MAGSPPYSLASIDWKKILIGAALAAAGAVAAYLTGEVIPQVEDSDVKLLLAAVVAVSLNVLRKLLGDTRTLHVLVLGLFVLPAQGAWAGEVAVIIDDSKPGAYLVEVDAAGKVTARPTKLVRPDGAPTPNPTPLPAPVPSARAKAISSAAMRVQGDADRVQTSRGLAVLYRELAKLARDPSKVKDPTSLANGVKAATDSFLAQRLAAEPWEPVREVFRTQWTEVQARGGSLTEFAALLDEAADGFDDSVPLRAIDPAIIALIMKILELILPLLLK